MWGSLRLAPNRILTKLHLTMAHFDSLLRACEMGDIKEAVRILSAQEFDPRWLSLKDGRGEGLTPLHCACRSGNVRLVRILVEEYHCDPQIKGGEAIWSKMNFTPLHEACRYKFPVIYLYLCSAATVFV